MWKIGWIKFLKVQINQKFFFSITYAELIFLEGFLNQFWAIKYFHTSYKKKRFLKLHHQVTFILFFNQQINLIRIYVDLGHSAMDRNKMLINLG